jgi:hypothetical protein
MSHKRIVYTRSDGGVSIVIPSDNFINQFDGTEAEAIDFIKNKDVPVKLTESGIINDNPVSIGQLVSRFDAKANSISFEEIPYQIVNDTDIPTDRTNRDAWTWQ